MPEQKVNWERSRAVISLDWFGSVSRQQYDAVLRETDLVAYDCTELAFLAAFLVYEDIQHSIESIFLTGSFAFSEFRGSLRS